LQSPVPEAEEAPSIPESIENLGLTSEQRSRIEEILQQSHDQLRQAWESYHAAHMRALELEANWIASLRDNLNQNERREFDERRREFAYQLDDEVSRARPGELEEDDPHRVPAPAEDLYIIVKPAAEDERSSDQGDRTSENSESSSESAAAGDKESAPDAPSDIPAGEAGTSESSQQSADDLSAQSQADETPEYVVFGISVLSPEHSIDHEPMSRSQQSRCSRVCRQYRKAMRTTWLDLHRAHQQMIEIEAKKLAAIEDVLNDEQLDQLQREREQPAQFRAAAHTGENHDASGSEDSQRESSGDGEGQQ